MQHVRTMKRRLCRCAACGSVGDFSFFPPVVENVKGQPDGFFVSSLAKATQADKLKEGLPFSAKALKKDPKLADVLQGMTTIMIGRRLQNFVTRGALVCGRYKVHRVKKQTLHTLWSVTDIEVERRLAQRVRGHSLPRH